MFANTQAEFPGHGQGPYAVTLVRGGAGTGAFEDARTALSGADKVKPDISVDQSAATATWLGAFRPVLNALKGANADAIIEGDKINVGGAAMDDDARDRIIARLKSALGAGAVVGALTDKTAASVTVANDCATTELAPSWLCGQGPLVRA